MYYIHGKGNLLKIYKAYGREWGGAAPKPPSLESAGGGYFYAAQCIPHLHACVVGASDVLQ